MKYVTKFMRQEEIFPDITWKTRKFHYYAEMERSTYLKSSIAFLLILMLSVSIAKEVLCLNDYEPLGTLTRNQRSKPPPRLETNISLELQNLRARLQILAT